MNPPRSSNSNPSTTRPPVYWNRTDRTVRDWKTDQELPHYAGPCIYFSDLRGAVIMYTFVRGGIRHWHDDTIPTAWTVENSTLCSLSGQQSRNE